MTYHYARRYAHYKIPVRIGYRYGEDIYRGNLFFKSVGIFQSTHILNL